MNNKYLQFERKNDSVTELFIYGDIRKPGILEKWFGDDSRRADAYGFKEQLKEVDTPKLLVRINSYGGSVSEALAIYSLLNTFPGEVTTIVDGFACSAASVIFMVGKNRIVPESGLLMIHNASSEASGDYRDLKKASEDLEKIQQPSVDIYSSKTGLSEEKIRELMDDETWINSKMAFELGFATTLEKNDDAVQAIESKFVVKMVDKIQKLELAKRELESQLDEIKKINSNKNEKIEERIEDTWDSFFN